MSRIEVKIPDIGNFSGVPVVEIAVAIGDLVAAGDTILMIESDKATLDIPAPADGTIVSISAKVGDRVSHGDIVMEIDAEADDVSSASNVTAQTSQAANGGSVSRSPLPELAGETLRTQLVVLGAGPGGYTAAFRAADLGMEVTLVERWPMLGGVCLNVGCIPSKALLHAAKVIDEVEELSAHGVSFGKRKVDVDALRQWKDQVVGKLTKGLNALAKRRRVRVVRGSGTFAGPNLLRIAGEDGETLMAFEKAIIACGSEPVRLALLPDDPRVIDSTGALALSSIPKRLLVLGGGVIGMEMAQVYHALGSAITIVELADQIIPGADLDIVTPLMMRVQKRYEKVLLQTKVTQVEAAVNGLTVTFDGPDGSFKEVFDAILSAVGRRPRGAMIGAEFAGVTVDERGFIPVDSHMRTNRPHIFAVGDVVGQPMLAHKAVHEAKVAAEFAAGHKAAFDARVIPSVAYTDPEVAWVGLTENEAKAKNIPYKKGAFPWAASGRSLSMMRQDGLSKLLFDPDTKRLLGAGLTGPNAGELLAEAALAIEMGADADDIALTIHPHPTLSETIGLAAEVFAGTITDL